MGGYKKGILGNFRGKVGTVVGSVWKGIHYMRSLPDFSSSNPSEAQLNTRARLILIMAFLKPLKTLLNIGYHAFNKGLTPFNAATSYHLRFAISGTAPAYTINYAKVIFSVGDLEEANLPDVETTVTAQVKFNWEPNGVMEFGKPTDLAMLLVYNAVKNKFVSVRGITQRSVLTYTMMLPVDFSGDTIYCWMGFMSDDGKMVSNSTYVGTIPVI